MINSRAKKEQTYTDKALKKLSDLNFIQSGHTETLEIFPYCAESAYQLLNKLEELTFLNQEVVNLAFANIDSTPEIKDIYENHPESFTRFDNIAILLKHPKYLGVIVEVFALIAQIPSLNKSKNYTAILQCVERKCDIEQLSFLYLNFYALAHIGVEKHGLLPDYKNSLLTQENFDSLLRFADSSKKIWRAYREINEMTQDKFTTLIIAFAKNLTYQKPKENRFLSIFSSKKVPHKKAEHKSENEHSQQNSSKSLFTWS